MNGLRRIFGKRKTTLEELKSGLQPTPDSDGVTRILSKDLWANPEIAAFLTRMGRTPDDPSNRVTTAEEYSAWFARQREALMERVATFNRENAERHGHCNARPMLIIAPEIWDGPHGAFLYGQLDLCGFDDWNILMCAGDQETIDRCGLVGHPGSIPALTQKMTEKIVGLKELHRKAHDALGLRILEQGGIDGQEYDHIVGVLRQQLIDYVAFCRSKTVELLSRRAA